MFFTAKEIEALKKFSPTADKSFPYRMLGRLQHDCEYFLGHGNGYEGHLWAKNVDEQIAEMKKIYNSFSEKEKPEWLSMDKINEYEKKMKDKVKASK